MGTVFNAQKTQNFINGDIVYNYLNDHGIEGKRSTRL